MERTVQQPEYLTLEQAAAELDISVAGVRKAIQRGTLKAVRRSPRRRVISRGAIEAYRTRGVRLEVPIRTIEELRADFEQETGMTARAWQDAWRAGRIPESADSFRLGATAMTILAVDAEDGSGQRRGPGRPRRAATATRSA